MNKIKKLGIAVIALAMCLLLGVTVWAADSEVKFEATASDTDFCITGEEQTVTVIISASEAIGLFSLDADLIVPAGWSATVSSVDLPEDGFFYNGKNVIWIDSEADGEISAEDLIKIEATIPANVEAGTYTIGVESLELTDVTINGKTYSEIYWTEDATLSVEITVKAHEYVPGDYVWTDDASACTVTGTCACGTKKEATAKVTSTQTKVPTCSEKGETTYTATFTETWAKKQTKVVDVAINEDAHAYSDDIKGYIVDADGTHTAYYTCAYNVDHKKYDDPVPHVYAEGKCVCGAEEIVAPAGLKGDVNLDGKVDALDLDIMVQVVPGIAELINAQALINADVNEDGNIDAVDLDKFVRFVPGIITDWNQD